MSIRRRYRRKPSAAVTAVRLDLQTDGFTYRKWGGEQKCKRGDWVVDNNGDVYTVDGDVFARTYRQVGPGIYVKTTPVWAEVAEKGGVIETIEGQSRYAPGDYIVFNDKEGTDGYCVSAREFEELYEPEA
jgi:squalene cyclase